MFDSRNGQRPDPVPGTVASFFSGGGGATLGLVRAGWSPVSFSEVEPYPLAVLKTHWPNVPQLGDITSVGADEVPDATLWLGGFPCQDLSLAGPRRGLTDDEGQLTRSGLAYTFLDLVERRRPRAILLENVRGLLSSNQGRDFAALQDQVADIGYSCAWRLLDAQLGAVPQRRQRVFILALDLEQYPDEYLPGEVLGVTSTCARDHQQEQEAWRTAAASPGADSAEGGLFNATAKFGEWRTGTIAGTLSRRDYKSSNHLIVGRQASYPNGGGEVDGTPGRVDDPDPIGMDSKRFQVIGNGLVTTMTQWIGSRLLRALTTPSARS